MNESIYHFLNQLNEHASKADHLPAYEAISRLIKRLEQNEIAERDLPLQRLSNTVDKLAQHKIHRNDLLIDILWMLDGYGSAIKMGEVTRKINQELLRIEQINQEITDQISNTFNIDFKEIPPANSSEGAQDTFEMFARDFLLLLGYEIEEGPSRGADGGKDLIVIEYPTSASTTEQKRWLVSCKHYAHSGQSVRDKDELNILDRVEGFKADGFLAFYSTLPSSGLNDRFTRLQNKIFVKVLDQRQIEHHLVTEDRLESIIKRYFTLSYKRKSEQRINFNFEKKVRVLDYEKKSKHQEATRRNDAISLLKANREYNRKLRLLQEQRDLELLYLEES